MKNCSGGAFDDFLTKVGGRFAPKINVNLYYLKLGTEYFLLFNAFFHIFRENGEKPFLGPESLSKGRGHLATKTNITIIEENEVRVFFHGTIFSKRHFSRKWRKKIFG